MKTHFKSDEIAHVWANQGAPRGECSASMSFAVDVFYSYSTAIARRVHHKGASAYLINDQSFSVTTSRHQGLVRQAISGLVLHYSAPNGTQLNPSPREMLDYALQQSADAQAAAKKARTRADSHLAHAAQWLNRAQAVVDFYGLRVKIDEKAVTRLEAAKAREEKRQAKEQAKRIARQAEEQREDMEKWLAGEDVRSYFSALPIRFRIESDELVSSRGARVPTTEAERAVAFALKMRAKGWHRNGETFGVGMYQFDAINEQGVVIGCHRIEWSEVERVASMLAPVPA